MNLGQMLKAARMAKKDADPRWTQGHVARLLIGRNGSPMPFPQVISDYEAGRSVPSVDRMAELIVILELPEAQAWRAYFDARLPESMLSALKAGREPWSP